MFKLINKRNKCTINKIAKKKKKNKQTYLHTHTYIYIYKLTPSTNHWINKI